MNSPRAGGPKLKRALQFATLLAICIWLLYQINYSYPHRKSSQSISSEKPSIVMGRKVTMGWLTRENEPRSEGEKIIEKSKDLESGALDDQLAKSHEEKANKMKGTDLELVINKTGETKLGVEFFQFSSFDDENGVPIGFNDED